MTEAQIQNNEREMVTVIQFTKQAAPYRKGELAGFPKEKAERYIAGDFATFVKEIPKAPPVLAGDSPAAVRSRHIRQQWEEKYG